MSEPVVPLGLGPLLGDFDKLELLYKSAGLMNLGLDANVLNEYRYFARALVDLIKSHANESERDLALARAETAHSAALCDTVDNIHLHARSSLTKIRDTYPAFDLTGHLYRAELADVFDDLKWLEKEISRSREDRSARKSIYQDIANDPRFARIIDLAQELPKINGAAPASLAPDSWLKKILAGLENGEFRLEFQPKRDSQTHRIVGAEALLRWSKANGTVNISPAIFIPKAEETGAIHMLGDFVIDKACEALGSWHKNPKLSHLKLSINVSPTQLIDPDFSANLIKKLVHHSISHEKFEIEITEEVLIRDKVGAARHIAALKNCRLAVDDFGKGSTEFQYLAEFKVHTIKLDRSLIVDALYDNAANSKIDPLPLGHDPERVVTRNRRAYRTLVEGIVALGKAVGAEIVAEGVEDESYLDMINVLKIPVYQGFVKNGKPKSVLAFEQLVMDEG